MLDDRRDVSATPSRVIACNRSASAPSVSSAAYRAVAGTTCSPRTDRSRGRATEASTSGVAVRSFAAEVGLVTAMRASIGSGAEVAFVVARFGDWLMSWLLMCGREVAGGRGRHPEYLPRNNQVGVLTDDLPIHGVPIRPPPSDRFIRGARPQLPGGETPQRVPFTYDNPHRPTGPHLGVPSRSPISRPIR